MSPKVSVIVPVYNNEVFVVSCIKSLLAQTLEDIEIIAINDGSTDNSSAILHKFADSDSRLIVVDKANGGYGVGINTGLDLVRGEYVTILESDDFADLDMLETLVNYADAFNLEVVRSNFYLYWAKKIKNDHLLELFGYHECDRIIDPSLRENQHCFYVQPALWSAITERILLRTITFACWRPLGQPIKTLRLILRSGHAPNVLCLYINHLFTIAKITKLPPSITLER